MSAIGISRQGIIQCIGSSREGNGINLIVFDIPAARLSGSNGERRKLELRSL